MIILNVLTSTSLHQIEIDEAVPLKSALSKFFTDEENVNLFYDQEMKERIDTGRVAGELELPGLVYSDCDSSGSGVVSRGVDGSGSKNSRSGRSKNSKNSRSSSGKSSDSITITDKDNTNDSVDDSVNDTKTIPSTKKERDAFCAHGANAMCLNCTPIAPYDPGLLKKHGIKYLSYEAYREKNSGSKGIYRTDYRGVTGKGNDSTRDTSRNTSRDNTSRDTSRDNTSSNSTRNTPSTSTAEPPLYFEYAHNTTCKSHGPTTRCPACLPKSHTLKPQPYRMIDHLEIREASLINTFLSYWRISAKERLAYLVGRVEAFEYVPMGRKAVVMAVYVPEQENYPDGFVVREGRGVEGMVGVMGMEVLGIVYTRLNDVSRVSSRGSGGVGGNSSGSGVGRDGSRGGVGRDGSGSTNGEGEARADDFVVPSPVEIQMMAEFQNDFPFKEGKCGGLFNSRFLSVIVKSGRHSANAGNTSNAGDTAITLHPFALSLQCTSLISQNIIRPTNADIFVSDRDIIYFVVNEYKLVVERVGRKVPVEYFLVDVPHGFTRSECVYDSSSNNSNSNNSSNNNSNNSNSSNRVSDNNGRDSNSNTANANAVNANTSNSNTANTVNTASNGNTANTVNAASTASTANNSNTTRSLYNGMFFNPQWRNKKVSDYFGSFDFRLFCNFDVLVWFYRNYGLCDDVRLLLRCVREWYDSSGRGDVGRSGRSGRNGRDSGRSDVGRSGLDSSGRDTSKGSGESGESGKSGESGESDLAPPLFLTFKASTTFDKFKSMVNSYKVEEWDCMVCTFRNNGDRGACEMCETVKGGA